MVLSVNSVFAGENILSRLPARVFYNHRYNIQIYHFISYTRGCMKSALTLGMKLGYQRERKLENAE